MTNEGAYRTIRTTKGICLAWILKNPHDGSESVATHARTFRRSPHICLRRERHQ